MFGPVPETPPEVLQVQLAGKPAPVLIDVRTPGEFAESRIAGAVNIPLPELPSRLDELPDARDTPVVTICRSAKRTIAATHLLLQTGYADARQLAGGMLAWEAAGLPVIRD